MTSRETIVKTIRINKPALRDLPHVPVFDSPATVQKFQEGLSRIGGYAFEKSEDERLDVIVSNIFPNVKCIASNIIRSSVEVTRYTSKLVLNSIDLAVLSCEIGVAENGAVFITHESMINRTLPFIAQHLVLVLERKNIASNMHEAYSKISRSHDYGVFIAGPSKTADIEQSLVIGAHGPKSLTVILV